MNAPWPGPTHPTGPAGPGPSGPAGPAPQPSGPAPGGPQTPSPTDSTGLASLVADAETQLSGPLHLLATAAAQLPDNAPARRDLNAAAAHLNCALIWLARLSTPARQVPLVGAHEDDTLSAPGGPGTEPSVLRTGKELTPSSADAAPVQAATSESGGPRQPFAGASSGADEMVGTGKERAPRSAAAAPTAVCESRRVAVTTSEAGAQLPARQVPLTRARVTDAAGVPDGLGPNSGRGGEGPGWTPGRPGRFSLPNVRPELRFDEGPVRVYGRIDMPEIGVGPLYDFPAREPLAGDPLQRPRRWA